MPLEFLTPGILASTVPNKHHGAFAVSALFPGAAQFLGKEREETSAGLSLGSVVEPRHEFSDPAPSRLSQGVVGYSSC